MSSLPASMRAVAITAPGGPEVLHLVERPRPDPAAGEILIEVAAAGVNRPDCLQRQGHYPPPPGASDLPGLEVAGRVAALGFGVAGWALGDPVVALVAGGGYAGYCVAPAPQCLPLPAGLGMVEGAALPETFFTVWANVFDRGRLRAGETFLVHGGTSGIGSTAIPLAKALGARVFATAGGAAKVAACRALGADVAIDHREEDFVAVVKAATDGVGVDLILDMVGGDYIPRNIDALALDGRHVSIAFLRGGKATVNIQQVMAKRLTLTGSTLRARPVAEKGAIAQALAATVWPLLAAGTIKPLIHATFPLERADEAHALMESNQHIGKIVLTCCRKGPGAHEKA